MVVTVGEPLDLSSITCRCNQPGEDQTKVWKDIAAKMQAAMQQLEQRSPPNADQLKNQAAQAQASSSSSSSNSNSSSSRGSVNARVGGGDDDGSAAGSAAGSFGYHAGITSSSGSTMTTARGGLLV